MPVRKCTAEDLDAIIDSAYRTFGEKIRNYSLARAYVKKRLESSCGVIFQCEDSYAIVTRSTLFFDSALPEVEVQYFWGPDIVRLFNHIKAWAKQQGLSDIYFQPRTGYNAARLAKAIGAKEDHPSYVWNI